MSTGIEKKPFTAEMQRARFRAGGSGKASAAQGALGGPVDAAGIAEVLLAIKGLRDDIRHLEHQLVPETAAAEQLAAQEEEEDQLLKKKTEVNILRTELRAMGVCIQQTKQEIAALRPSYTEDDRLMAVTHELDAIVTATERATQDILESAEKIDNISHNMRSQEGDSFRGRQADEIIELVVTIFEACNFQDITGQRITKVVNTLKYIEERVNAMVDIWGAENFEDVTPAGQQDLDEDAKLLNGPQLETKAISQDEIDALFG